MGLTMDEGPMLIFIRAPAPSEALYREVSVLARLCRFPYNRWGGKYDSEKLCDVQRPYD